MIELLGVMVVECGVLVMGVGAITSEGKFLSADEVKALAVLPSKDALRGMLVGTLAAPLSGFVGVLSGNLRQFATVLEARAKTIN
jgi:large subunit ribosomal protein L10